MSDSSTDQAVLNRLWCRIIIEELCRFGVEHVCIAPGSRSTPLTLEADSNNKLTLHTHFDERGLAFHALGMAKTSNKPVAVIVTSGTAVANLLPAIAESGLTKEKLLLLTADRPIELIDCGANQAISQVDIFAQHITASLNLPSPNRQVSPQWLLTSIDQLMVKQHLEGGAIHINCPFPEPLYSDQIISEESDYLASIEPWLKQQDSYCQYHSCRIESCDVLEPLQDRKGVIAVGQVDLATAQAVAQLASTLGWPLLCDPQSGISSDWQHYDIWLQNQQAHRELAQCDVILQFGARFVSKRIHAFIKNSECDYILVSEGDDRLNPNHLPLTRISAQPLQWAKQQQKRLADKRGCYFGWADELIRFSKQVKQLAVNCSGLSGNDASELAMPANELSELRMAARLNEIAANHDLFIGNSLIVRLVDMVTALSDNQVYTNRGASGIDGLVATATGVQAVNQQPMLMLVGDTSLLYDLNSLSLCSRGVPLVIVVTNNDGGAIFDLLPVPEQQKQNLYKMPHGYQFKYAALQFGLAYLKPDSLAELISCAQEHLTSGQGSLLIEVITPSEQASSDIKALVKSINAYH